MRGIKIEDEVGKWWLPELGKMMRTIFGHAKCKGPMGVPERHPGAAGHMGLELRARLGWKIVWESPACEDKNEVMVRERLSMRPPQSEVHPQGTEAHERGREEEPER